jgi:hypothetical protein
MIQRIQTIFLALVVILGIIFSFVPVLGFTGYELDGMMYSYKTLGVGHGATVIANNMGVGVVQGLIILVALVSIFLFKNRGLQMKLGKLNILLIALQIAAIVMYIDTVKLAIGKPVEDVVVSFEIGSIIPLISLILTYLSIRFIKKDEKLVRAADRLR